MSELKVGVVGAGVMGRDHIRRLVHRTTRVSITAIVEPDKKRAESASSLAPKARWFSSFEQALEERNFDAVLVATPGAFHESVLLPALKQNLFILCEKPLTMGSASALRVVEAEAALASPRIQVGFMRRFDRGYRQLRELTAGGSLGELLLMHAAHRNAVAPASFEVTEMLINDSLVHEIDVLPWVAGSKVASIEVKKPRSNRNSARQLEDPQFIVFRLDNGVLVDVEMNINCGFGYQVRTEAVFESGLARIGDEDSMFTTKGSHWGRQISADFTGRFEAAYDAEVQAWVDAALLGKTTGPTAYEGYLASAVCEAGIISQKTGQEVEVNYAR